MAYKILWYSIPALHDNSNGAAIHNKILLESLAARGIEVKVLNALVADDPKGLEIFNVLNQHFKFDPKLNYLQFTDNNVEYIVAKTQGHTSETVTVADQGRIFDFFTQILEKWQPDLIMGYSGDFFSAFLRREAQARGIPVVYALCNGLHRSFSFADCDAVFAPSEATAKLYRELDDTKVEAVGQFIRREMVVAPQREPKYVTLINPTPEKGLAIFVKLVEKFIQKHPETKFLVVKSVGNLADILRALHNVDGTPYFKPNQPNVFQYVDVAEHTNDIRLVYKLTKVLLAPSVWHESWGCVATEANINNIPVLATNSGGLPEAVREGGILLNPPQSTLRDFYCVPTDEEIEPYVEALERLLNEDWTAQCQKASEANDLNKSVDNVLQLITPLMEKGSKTKRPLESSYFFSEKSMLRRKAAYERVAEQRAAQAAAAAQDTASNVAEQSIAPESKPSVSQPSAAEHQEGSDSKEDKVAVAANVDLEQKSAKAAKAKSKQGQQLSLPIEGEEAAAPAKSEKKSTGTKSRAKKSGNSRAKAKSANK